MTNLLLETLRSLEIELHQPDVRADVERLGLLLHDDFVEIGRSGKRYKKSDIIQRLQSEKSADKIWSQDYAVEEIGDGLALLTYKSAHINAHREMTRYTNRVSLWQFTAQGWQMRFHQGAATGAFVRADMRPKES